MVWKRGGILNILLKWSHWVPLITILQHASNSHAVSFCGMSCILFDGNTKQNNVNKSGNFKVCC